MLVTDDDAGVLDLVAGHLRGSGMDVVAVGTGEEALDRLRAGGVEVAILDVHLPGIGGLDVLRTLRSEQSSVAVILLTAAGSEVDRVVGLELGADDYVVKPFSVRELEARVKAVLRRNGRGSGARRLVVGDVVVDADARLVTKAGRPVDLTPREFDLLAFLAAHPGRVFSRDELLRKVWGSSAAWQQASTVTEHVRRIRRKLEDDPARPRLIRTVRSSGYRLDPDG